MNTLWNKFEEGFADKGIVEIVEPVWTFDAFDELNHP
jgi:hypothetical protein